MLRLQHIAVASDDQRGIAISYGQHGLQTAQHPVGAPVFGQLDGRAHQMPLVFLQLGLKALEQGECIGSGAGKTGQHFAVVELAHLARRALDHDVAERYLAVAADGDLRAVRRVTPHADDGGTVKLFHEGLKSGWRGQKQGVLSLQVRKLPA